MTDTNIVNGNNVNGKPSLGVQLDDEDVIKFIAAQAAKLADEELSKRENRWRAVMTLIVLVLGVLGYRSIEPAATSAATVALDTASTKLESRIDEKISSAVEGSIGPRIERVQAGLEALKTEHKDDLELHRTEVASQVAYMSLQVLAVRMEMAKGISDADRQAVLELLDRVSKSEMVRAQPEFLMALEKVLDAFVATESTEQILELDRKYRSSIIKANGMIVSMNLFLGMWVIGNVDPGEEVVAAQKYYSELAMRQRDLRAVALPFIMMLSYMDGEAGKEHLDSYFEMLTTLSDAEKETIVSAVQSLAAGRDESPTVYFSGKKFRELVDKYPEYFPPTGDEADQEKLLEALRNMVSTDEESALENP